MLTCFNIDVSALQKKEPKVYLGLRILNPGGYLSWLESFSYTEEVAGSSPVPPTKEKHSIGVFFVIKTSLF